jgi:hypothetical protein
MKQKRKSTSEKNTKSIGRSVNMTRIQLQKALSHHNYIAARWSDGDVTGINCRAALLSLKKCAINDQPSSIIGFYPISFQEYIRIKIPFLSIYSSRKN